MSRAIPVFRTGSQATVSVGAGLCIKGFLLSMQIHKVHHNETD